MKTHQHRALATCISRAVCRAFATLAVATAFAGSAAHAAADSGKAMPAGVPAKWHGLLKQFDPTLSEYRVVGGSIALVMDGRIVERHDYGFADVAAQRKVDGDTLFHWASITKTLNAISVMQMRDEGKIALSDRIVRYVPELRQMHNPYGSMDTITLQMLLTHSAGFQSATWPYKSGAAWEPFEPTSWSQLVAMMPYQQIEFQPGSRFSYSNPAWIYLARIVEQKSGDPWEYYIQKHIFAPLGMTRSYMGYTPDYLKKDRSHRYFVEKGADGKPVTHALSGEFDPGITIPNGGWNSPLADMAKYLGFLTGAARGDPQVQARYDSVLSHETLQEMWQPRLTIDDSPEHEQMGLAFFIVEQHGARIIGHTGGQAGFTSFMYFNPATKVGVVAAFNTANLLQPPEKPGYFSTLKDAAIEMLE